MAGDPQPESDGISFGDLLRSHRLAAGLTQEALAERAGLSTRGISDLERGVRTQPYRETLRQLVVALGIGGEDRVAFLRAARGPARPATGAARSVIVDLPIPLNRLVGREREVAAVASLVADEAVRLVTLTGPAGVGKTRLALAVAAEAGRPFPDGVVFVDLAPVRDPALLPDIVAARLGLEGPGAVAPMDYLRRVLPDRKTLLLLDNFEHLLDAAPVVGDLLRAGPGVKAMVTSREILRVRGEQVYPVPPLAVPEPVTTGGRDDVLRSESVRLFVLRAVETDAGFSLTDDNAAAVAGICRELDGLPLAIELAAPRITVLPPGQLLTRLEQRLPLLTGGTRDAPARQRTLRDAIAWSYDLLTADERALFCRLGVFIGGWTLEAAERVAAVDGMPDLLLGLASLVDKSLVRRDDRGGEPRFAMLETIREFAVERLQAMDAEGRAVRAVYARYFLGLAEEAQAGLIGPRQSDWLDRLDAEDANIRAALSWSIAEGEAELALRGARALWRYWTSRGRLREGRSWLEQALAMPDAAPVPLDVRADAHNALGNLLGDSGEFILARAQYETALDLRRELGDTEAVAGALNNLGLIAAWLGDYATAKTLHAESLDLRQERRDPFAVALSLSNLSDVALAEGDLERARAWQEEAMRLRDAARDALGSAYSRFNLGEIARLRGELDPANALLEESLRRFEELGDRIGIAYAETSLGDLASRRGDSRAAAELLGNALRIRSEIGDTRGTVECLEAIALAAVRHGDEPAARRLLRIAGDWRDAIACPTPPSLAADHQRELAGLTRPGMAEDEAIETGDAEAGLALAWHLLDRLAAAREPVASPGPG
jgi:predicted ATPase/transcriptional regulator with XRE-family HTH domain